MEKDILPVRFKFYDHGHVELASPGMSELSDAVQKKLPHLQGFGYSIFDIGSESESSTKTTVIVAFDQDYDHGIYLEIGNILASQIADAVAAGEDVGQTMISPPFEVKSAALSKIVARNKNLDIRRYHYINQNEVVEFYLFMIPSESVIHYA